MAVIRLSGFHGENRALQPMLLPETVGTTSLNQKPGRGDLRPWHLPKHVATVPSGHKTIYRFGRDLPDDAWYWFSWPGVVHAVRGFDPDDTTELTFFTGDGAPKYTTLAGNISAGPGPYPRTDQVINLGVPAPPTAPVVTTSGDFTAAQATFATYFVYTYVNDRGWESQASPVSNGGLTFNAFSGLGRNTISGFAQPPTGHNITKMRLYISQGSLTGDTAFYFVREMALTETSWTYAVYQPFAVGELLQTKDWAVPPADLTQLTPMWNGMLAGIAGGAVRFCEPYVPYAWPATYDVVPPDSRVVALGVFGQSLLALTTSRPLLVQGSHPQSLDQLPLEIPQGCVSSRSAVSMGTGVAWASADGLCWYGADGARIVTAGLMTRDDWQAIKPATIIGQMYEGLYLGSYSLDGGVTRKGFMIDPQKPTGIYFLDKGYEAMYFDELQDQLYVLDGTGVQRWDGWNEFPEFVMKTTFVSKQFRLPYPAVAFAWAEVIASGNDFLVTLTIDALEVEAGEVLAMLERYPGTLTAPTPTSLRYSLGLPAVKKPFRLPGGFVAPVWQITVEAYGPVQGVALAHSAEELRQI